MNKDYATDRASVLKKLDGIKVEVDAEKKIGYLILDQPPLNIVSYTGRSQIRALIEAMDKDDDVVSSSYVEKAEFIRQAVM